MEIFNEHRVVGTLDPFYETGTEGVIWAIVDDERYGIESLVPLLDGDYIFIEDLEGDIIWEGVVKLNYRTNWRERSDDGYGQQSVLGYWVHGLQEDIEPETWATWFFEGRRAVLIKGGFEDGTPVTNRFE